MSETDGRLYIGLTPDLRKRIDKHERGFVTATKHRRPLQLIHYEAYLELSDAKRREKYLKGGKGRSELKIQLENCFAKVKYKFRF